MEAAALDKFRKICGLLGSDQDGERATAARMATDLLKVNGLSWKAVSFGAPPERTAETIVSLTAQLRITQQLLGDERARSTRLAEQLNQMKKTIEQLVAEKVQELNREPNRKKSRPKTLKGDDELRESTITALREIDHMAERSREFLESVIRQPKWTDKQREAVIKTLKWVYRS